MGLAPFSWGTSLTKPFQLRFGFQYQKDSMRMHPKLTPIPWGNQYYQQKPAKLNKMWVNYKNKKQHKLPPNPKQKQLKKKMIH